MAWGYGASGAFVDGLIASGSPTLDVAYPTGITAGQLLTINYYSRNGGGGGNNLSIPSGWESLIYQDTLGRTGLIGKVADGTETGTLSLSFPGDGAVSAQMARFTTGTTGWTLAAQVHATASALSAPTADAPTVALAISEASTLVLVTAGRNKNITPFTAPPANFTQIGEIGNTPNFLCSAWAYWIQTTATNVPADKFDSAATSSDGSTRSTIVSLIAPTPTVGPMTGTAGIAFSLTGVMTGAPVFDTAPSVTSQTATAYTVSYEASATATNIYLGAYARGATAPTAAQVEAGTGARGTATEATTGAADTIVLTPTDSPAFPTYDIYVVLKGASGYSPVVALLNQQLLTPTGKQKVVLTGVDVASPLYGSDAVAGDFWIVDTLTDGGYAVGISTDGLFTISYAGTDRQIFEHDFYDVSAVGYEGEGEVVVNNKAPNFALPPVFTAEYVLAYGSAMTAVDLSLLAIDPEGDTVTATIEDALSGTSVTANVWSGTPAALQGATFHTFRWTDEYGDYYEEDATVSVGTVVPDVEGLSQSAATTAILNAGLVVDLAFANSDEVDEGDVISQSPAAGTVAEEGSAVTITISTSVAIVTFRFEMT
jgi:hypothetical protein